MKPISLQIVVDSQAPHDLADWWAETLGWEVEPQDEQFIRKMMDQGLVEEADTIVHNGSLVFASAAAIRPTEPAPGQPRIYFQHVPDPKASKNRMHFDLRPDRDGELDLAEFRQTLLARGASQVGDGQQGPHRWVVLADPEGNEFCLDAE